MASPNRTATRTLVPTPVGEAVGCEAVTVGAVVSGAVPVVNVHVVSDARATPAEEVTPPVMVAVKTVLAANVLDGANVADVASALLATTPATAVLPCLSVNV